MGEGDFVGNFFGNLLKDGKNYGQIDLNRDGGVLKKILKKGEYDTQPPAGCKVSIQYTGILQDATFDCNSPGTIFDSTLERNKPFEFELGKGMVVKGLDIGVASMNKGEKAVLKLKPEYGYGAAGGPYVPANATLVYDIELLDWTPEDISPRLNGGISRIVVKAPTSRKTTPNVEALVTVKMVGSYKGRLFEKRELSFNIGEANEFNREIIQGIHLGLTHFGKGEISKLIIKPEFAFGQKGNQTFGIPPNATIEYTVTLKEFEEEPDSSKLNAKESLAQAKLVKDKATTLLKQEKYELAIKMYEKSNNYLSNCEEKESIDLEDSDESTTSRVFVSNGEVKEARIVKAAVFSNIALCHLKLKNHDEVKKTCEKVLEIDPENVKAYFRRGTSLFETGKLAAALKDFQKVLELEQENKAAINQITICKQKIKRQNDKEKKACANIFSKLGDDDTEISQ